MKSDSEEEAAALETEAIVVMEALPTVGEYVLKSKLGCGSFSTVWKAENRETRQVVALKQVYLSRLNPLIRNSLDCELQFLSSVNHPNIVRLFNAFQADGCIYLVLEFCAGGNLASFIQQHGIVKENTARKFVQQIGAGLKIIRAHNVIHRDLKPENILLTSLEGEVVLKIADFGLSRTLYPGDYAEKVCGSPTYMAPEVLQFQRYDEKADLWSVGAILFELLNGYPPFVGRNNVQLLRSIKSYTYLPFSQVTLARLHPDCVDICSRLLSLNPENRLSFDEFYQHSFLRRWDLEFM